MADRAMTVAQTAIDRPADQVDLHPVMGLIGALWANFGSGKNAMQKRQMIAAWEAALDDIPVTLQLEAVKRKARAGQVWPPSSPAEVRQWCNAVQPPMNGMDVAWYRACIETGLLDASFCQHQIDKYNAAQAAGRAAYAGWD